MSEPTCMVNLRVRASTRMRVADADRIEALYARLQEAVLEAGLPPLAPLQRTDERDDIDLSPA